MIFHFTEEEISQWIQEEKQLLQPINYFFRQLKSFTEFEEVCGSMLSLQWQFFSSGLSLLKETFKALGEIAYSLLTLNFSLAGEKCCEAGKAALGALAKLILALLLLLLHAIRLLTLVAATFFPHVVILSLAIIIAYFSLPLLSMGLAEGLAGGLVFGACAGIATLCINNLFKKLKIYSSKPESLRRSSQGQDYFDLQEYKTVSEGIFEERRQLIATIRSVCSDQDLLANAHYSFFQENAKSLEDPRLKIEADEFSRGLRELINNYPIFSADRAKTEPGYVRNITQELREHHTKARQAAESFLEKVNSLRTTQPLDIGHTN